MPDSKGDANEGGHHHEFVGPKTGDVEIPVTAGPNLVNEVTAYENRDVDVWTVMACVALAFTYEACLFSFVLPAAILLNINAAIGPSNRFNWIATAWSLAAAVVTTIAGRCSDIFGRRNFFIFGNALGLIGCVIASRASSINNVIAGSTLMGVGAGIQQLAFAASSEIVPKKWRGTVIALLNLAAVPGSAFGSVIAYALVAHLNWRWAFYLGVIANGFALSLIVIFYWPPNFLDLHLEDGKTRFDQLKELDFVGLLLSGGGLTCFLLGVSWGNNPYPWTSPHVLAPLIIGALSVMLAFPLWEIFSGDKIAKLCPPKMFRNVRGFTLPLSVTFLGGMMFMALQVLWPQEVQLLFTAVPVTVGWYSLAYNASALVGGVVAGSLFAIIKKTNYQYLAAIVIQTIFIGSMSSVTEHTSGRAIAFVAVSAFMVGAQQVIGLLIIQFGAEDDQIGVATGLAGSLRSTGGAVAIAIYGSIINSHVTENLGQTVAAVALQAGLPATEVPAFIVALTSGSAAGLNSIEGINSRIIAAGIAAQKGVYAGAFRLVFLVSIAFGVLACIVASFVSSVDGQLTRQIVAGVSKPHLTSNVRDNELRLKVMENDDGVGKEITE